MSCVDNVLIDDYPVHSARVDQRSGQPDIHSGFQFIAREHPHLDPGVAETVNRVAYVCLKFVLNRRYTDQFNITL